MKSLLLGAFAAAALLASSVPAQAADVVLKDLESPPGCEWRRAGKRPEAAPILYCPDDKKVMRVARMPRGFKADTLARARAGDAEAMNLAGLLHLDGPPFLRDPAAGQEWLRKGAEAGSADARFNLALALDAGKGGVTKDPAAAAGWYRKGADLGDADAMVNLGEMLLTGRGVPRDDAEALKLMRGAEANVDARYNLAAMTFEGRGLPGDKPAAIALLRKAAEADSAEAAWKLGRIYAAGDGAPADVGEAVHWTRKAGEKKMRVAAILLGFFYIVLPEQTLKEARDGDARAQLTIALQMLEGKRLKRDPKAAAALLVSGVRAGIPLAGFTLGELHADGDGVAKDPELALKLLAASLDGDFGPWARVDVFRTPTPPPAPAAAKKR